MEEKELTKLLKENLEYEKKVIEFYRDKFFLIPDKKTRRDILKLITQSYEHAYTFRKHLLKKQFEIETEKESMNEIQMTQFIEDGLKEEKRLEDTYKEEIERIENEEIKKDLKRIMKQEKGHQKILRNALSNIKEKSEENK